VHRGKRRSNSQLIGEVGEALFRVWALKRHLSPNKSEQDYGIDFFCQTLDPLCAKIIEEASGTTIAAVVRTCSGLQKTPRVKITRVDATNMLRQKHPVFLFAINETTSAVHFRLLDEEFASELSHLIESNRQSSRVNLSALSCVDSEFERLRSSSTFALSGLERGCLGSAAKPVRPSGRVGRRCVPVKGVGFLQLGRLEWT